MSGFPNVQHSDKWQAVFSNIPGFSPTISAYVHDMSLFDNYVKSVTFPSYTLELVKSNFMNYSINHPISKVNDDLNSINMDFKMSEGLMNYLILETWIRGLREEQNIDKQKYFRLNCIKELKLLFLDNMKRTKMKFIFENAFLTDLGSFSLTNGVDEEVTFSTTIAYEFLKVEPGEC